MEEAMPSIHAQRRLEQRSTGRGRGISGEKDALWHRLGSPSARAWASRWSLSLLSHLDQVAPETHGIGGIGGRIASTMRLK